MSGASISYSLQFHLESELHCGFDIKAEFPELQSRTDFRSANIAMATCYQPYELSPPPARTVQVPVQKDYTRPLHVDCSVEYELPNTAKPPQGVRNEPLLMIHPCYFRKIESQRRSPFVNNLPNVRQPPVAAAVKRRVRVQQTQPQPAAQYPVQVQYPDRWDQVPNLVPISQNYCSKRDQLASACGTTYANTESSHWTEPTHSPDRPEDKHILSGKYRQYLRAHRLHPYVTSAIPLASTFPQIQQVCYNVWSLWYDFADFDDFSTTDSFVASSVLVSVTLLVIIVCNFVSEMIQRKRRAPGVVVIPPHQLCLCNRRQFGFSRFGLSQLLQILSSSSICDISFSFKCRKQSPQLCLTLLLSYFWY